MVKRFFLTWGICSFFVVLPVSHHLPALVSCRVIENVLWMSVAICLSLTCTLFMKYECRFNVEFFSSRLQVYKCSLNACFSLFSLSSKWHFNVCLFTALVRLILPATSLIIWTFSSVFLFPSSSASLTRWLIHHFSSATARISFLLLFTNFTHTLVSTVLLPFTSPPTVLSVLSSLSCIRSPGYIFFFLILLSTFHFWKWNMCWFRSQQLNAPDTARFS